MSAPHESPPHPAVPFSAGHVPAALRERPQWVCWRYELRDGKPTKVPVTAGTGARASSTDPVTWSTFEDAVAALGRGDGLAGVGFVFAEDDPYCGVDLDGCIGPDGALVPAAAAIVAEFASYTEISPSGTGVKIICIADKPAAARCRSKSISGFHETEVYSSGRFFAITGRLLEGAPGEVREAQAAVDALCGRLWSVKPPRNAPPPADPAFDGDDEELLRRMFAAKNGEMARRLFDGDTSIHAGDDSGGDLAMCNLLAFWTGKDAARMDRLLRRSGRFREKWDERRGARTYGQMTIDRAIAGCTEVFTPRVQREAKPVGEPGAAPAGADAGEPDDPDGVVPLGQRDPVSGRLVLSPKRTLPTAEAFAREFFAHPDGPTLVSYAEVLRAWRGNRYVELEDGAVKQTLQPWLHGALRYVRNPRTKELTLEDFESNPTTVKAALDTTSSYVHLPVSTPMPSWLGEAADRPPPHEILPCLSHNLHIPTRTIIPATPRLFTTCALDFDYQCEPEPPEAWIRFLEQLWGDDLESVQLLQEWMGYCLTPDTGQQKILLLVGPRRSGKGTIGRVMRRLVGAGNVAGPTTSSLAEHFGLQPLIGKSLAIVSDARFSGEGVAIVIERLLCISGEDVLTVHRKYLSAVELKLAARFMFLSNELPRLSDASAALAGRFLILRLTRSFYDQEDTGLSERLYAELPGILHWALDGRQRLLERGRFVQPASAAEAVEELEALSSPVRAFVRDRCVVGDGQRASLDDLYAAWCRWCEEDGRSITPLRQTFGRDLASAVPTVTCRRGTGDRRFYDGIGLRGYTE